LDREQGLTGARFMANIQNASAYIPYLVTPGNHEYHGTSIGYYDPFFWGQTKLGKASGSTHPTLWWSVDIGQTHIIGISTEAYCVDATNIEAQWKWLNNDLQQARSRPVQPWIVVLGHRPIYYDLSQDFASQILRWGLQCTNSSLTSCNASLPCSSGVNCAYSIEKLLNRYHVDLVVAGHAHVYLRHYPIGYNYTYEPQNLQTIVNAQSPVYVVSGAAGTENGIPPAKRSGLNPPPANVFSADEGYSVMKAYNNTHLNFKQIAIKDGSIVDDFWIVKDAHKAPWTQVEKFVITTFEQATHCDDI